MPTVSKGWEKQGRLNREIWRLWGGNVDCSMPEPALKVAVEPDERAFAGAQAHFGCGWPGSRLFRGSAKNGTKHFMRYRAVSRASYSRAVRPSGSWNRRRSADTGESLSC